ncbi:methyltransferase domain-containing protein [Actinomadura soli]|uniref:Methyltransferase domain-containing protein n=1 Tax=Actinomadura soli TaxID=2508997 RepID=A0A5C4JBN3_9ACTN|nr:methyltransferase domain-containing protein [Actinomadura soli]TMQ99886.1 methyltransferase domain-containing protein [Actinomadura soli]
MTDASSRMDRVLDLLRDPPAEPDVSAGYLDLLGPSAKPSPSLAQSAMQSAFLPQIYERVWRPIGFNLAKGWPIGPDTATEHAMARDWLGLSHPGYAARPPATVLDVACGPGNVTRALAQGVGRDGLVIGLDASQTMLTRAVADSTGDEIRYVRGDAVDLPFSDASFDAVCCFGALYLFDDPWTAVDGMTRVLKPGGRLVILTSRRPGPLPAARFGTALLRRTTGFTVFGDREITSALSARGFTSIRQRRYPLMQMVGARRP